ncbi:hypothetical protein JCM11491_005348 [Sporobolomyces phaffii]
MSSGFDDYMSPFMGLPGFSPLSSFNLSGICATTRLLQCPMLGLSTVEVSGKFAPHKKESSTDLGPEMWEMLKKVLENVSQRLNKKGKRQEWYPILYGYELYRGAASNSMDFGQLVFTEGTLTKFLLVNVYEEPACKCGNPYHGDYAAIMKLQAQRFLNLLTILPMPNPAKFVRATYCTAAHPLPTDQFLFEEGPLNPSKYSTVSPIVHLTPTDLVACLNEHDLEVITATAARGNKQISDDKKRLVISKHGSGSYQPTQLPKEVSEEFKRECGGCHKVFPGSKLARCGGCKMAFYCGPACQKSHWPQHKQLCKLSQQKK